jgi:lipopolysaccharide biosynthesis glycosyltransferase
VTTPHDAVIVACAANAAYAIPLAVMLRSAANHLSSGRRLIAWIIDDGLGELARSRIAESLPDHTTIHWLAPARTGFDGLPLWGRMPVSTYDKLTVAECLPAELDKVIWLDCDMLVLADLAELWDLPLGDAHLLAVRDALVPNVSSRFGIGSFREMGLDASTPYFNAGVMVVDLIKWREFRVAAKALDYLRRFHDRVFFWDQEALNAVLSGKWNKADERWNWSANLDRLADGKSGSRNLPGQESRIVHFLGHIKPWIVRESSSTSERYFQILDETAWRGWRPTRSAVRSMVGWYGSSRVRRFLYPAEQVGMRLVWRLTRRQA